MSIIKAPIIKNRDKLKERKRSGKREERSVKREEFLTSVQRTLSQITEKTRKDILDSLPADYMEVMAAMPPAEDGFRIDGGVLIDQIMTHHGRYFFREYNNLLSLYKKAKAVIALGKIVEEHKALRASHVLTHDIPPHGTETLPPILKSEEQD